MEQGLWCLSGPRKGFILWMMGFVRHSATCTKLVGLYTKSNNKTVVSSSQSPCRKFASLNLLHSPQFNTDVFMTSNFLGAQLWPGPCPLYLPFLFWAAEKSRVGLILLGSLQGEILDLWAPFYFLYRLKSWKRSVYLPATYLFGSYHPCEEFYFSRLPLHSCVLFWILQKGFLKLQDPCRWTAGEAGVGEDRVKLLFGHHLSVSETLLTEGKE